MTGLDPAPAPPRSLFVAALDGAVTLAEVDHRSVLVGGDLHLDVSRRGDEPLDIDAVITERGAGLAARKTELGAHLIGIVSELDPAATAAGCRVQAGCARL